MLGSRILLEVMMISSALALGACAAPATEEGSTASAEEAFTAREGYTALANPRGGVYVSVAVSGRYAYVGDNRAAIDVVDLTTGRRKKTLEGRTPADALSVSGGLLAACGERDDQPLGWDAYYGARQRNYVVTIFDARTGKKQREIVLELQKHLDAGASGGFVDLPSLSCAIDAEAGTLSVAFSQKNLPHELVTLPLPAGDARYDFRDIPTATRVRLGASRDNTVKAFTTSARGVTWAAGGWGVRRVASGRATVSTLRDEGREHMVGLVERGHVLFAADHDGALRVVDADTGAAIAAVEIDDWLEGVAVSGELVVVVGREGLFVTKDRWSR